MHCIIINPPPSIFKVLFYLIPEERLTPISEISKIIMTKLKTSLCLLFLTFFFFRSNTPGFSKADSSLHPNDN